jgi:hypothetical protein
MKKQLPLPQEEIDLLNTLYVEDKNLFRHRLRLLWLGGWSLSILAESVSPQRPRATIHYWVRNVDTNTTTPENSQAIPEPKYPSPKTLVSALISDTPSTASRVAKPSIPDDMKQNLRSLSLQARRYRAKTTQDNQFAKANREFTALVKALKNQGVPAADIANAAGISYRAIARRIAK